MAGAAAVGAGRSRRTHEAAGEAGCQRPTAEAAEVAAALDESWPDHPEWVDMLDRDPSGRADELDLRLVPHGRGTDTL